MPNAINTTVPVHDTEGKHATNYFFSPKHRGIPTFDISVWNIGFDEELSCFSYSYLNKWHNNIVGWGIIASSINNFLILGQNSRSAELRIAKFVMDQNLWHGYPADVRSKPKDKPSPSILLIWFNNGLISKPAMARIKQGQL